MSTPNNISLEEVKMLIHNALSCFYSNDRELFEYRTEDGAVAERCMVFHIGWYILNYIAALDKFKWANVDCEYNRNFEHPKSMYKETLKGIRTKIKDTVPDLLIHKRKSNDQNLLVIEFKKGDPKRQDVLNDEEKLMYFTDLSNEYKYPYGLYIELHKRKAKVHVFQSGKHLSHLDYSLEF